MALKTNLRYEELLIARFLDFIGELIFRITFKKTNLVLGTDFILWTIKRKKRQSILENEKATWF